MKDLAAKALSLAIQKYFIDMYQFLRNPNAAKPDKDEFQREIEIAFNLAAGNLRAVRDLRTAQEKKLEMTIDQ